MELCLAGIKAKKNKKKKTEKNHLGAVNDLSIILFVQ